MSNQLLRQSTSRYDLGSLSKMSLDQRFMKWPLGFYKLQSYQSMYAIIMNNTKSNKAQTGITISDVQRRMGACVG